MRYYVKPAMEYHEAICGEMMALSLIEEKADNSEILVKEDKSWNIWSEEE